MAMISMMAPARMIEETGIILTSCGSDCSSRYDIRDIVQLNGMKILYG
jgi:hypothetical protein